MIMLYSDYSENGVITSCIPTIKCTEKKLVSAVNVEYTYTDFLHHFQTQFTDSTKQETAQAALDRHHFKFPFIDQYISDFKTLVRKVGYTVGSRETMNYFLKGLKTALDVMERVVEKIPTDYQDLKDKAVAVVKA
jgi:hypothetical protein